MAEKRNVKNYVAATSRQFPMSGRSTGSLPALISWLQIKLAEVPEEYRASTEIIFEGDGLENVSIGIYYEAPETEQQMHHRLLVEHEVWGTPLLQAAPPPTDPPAQGPGPSTGPEGGTPYI